MAPLTLILARHGESEANTQNILANTGFQFGLTSRGRVDAKNLAAHVADRFPNITQIYTSPLKRAVETAQIVSDDFQVSFEVNTNLIEFNVGELEGRSDEASWAEFRTLWERWFQDGDADAALNGGESLRQITRRLEAFFRWVRIEPRSHEGGSILVVGHGGTFTAALSQIVEGLSPEFWLRHRFRNADYLELRLEESAITLGHTSLMPVSFNRRSQEPEK